MDMLESSYILSQLSSKQTVPELCASKLSVLSFRICKSIVLPEEAHSVGSRSTFVCKVMLIVSD